MIKLFDPHVTDDEVAAARDVLLSRNWASGAGTNKVKEFEDAFNSYTGSSQCVALNSGTAALHLAASLYDVNGKDVYVPSLTFVSTAHAAIFNGGNPVFIDVNPETLCMDASSLQEKVRKGKGALVIPVHFGGMPCDMTGLIKVAKENDLHLVDDAAHACGATHRGAKIGGLKDITTCFSFHPVKNLSMPTGGAITLNTNDHVVMKKKLNSWRWCGIDNRQGYSYDVTSVSTNYYMNEVSAAIGLVQLAKLDKLNARRREIAKRYSAEIKLEYKMPFSSECAYHLYWIVPKDREKMIKHLYSKGIEVGTHYRPVHTMTAYNGGPGVDRNHLKITEDVGSRIITIPIHPNLTENDVSHIIQSINSFC